MSEETEKLKVEPRTVPLEQKVDMIERALERLLDVLRDGIGQLDSRLPGKIEEIVAILKVPPQT